MRDVFGNAIGVVGVVAGPMLVVLLVSRKPKFARRFSVMLTGASMIALLAWMYLHRV
jgi:hypothetical protein